MTNFKYKVCEKLDNKTILDFLSYYHVSKAKKKNLLNIMINGQKASMNSIIKTADTISIDYDEEPDFIPLDKKLDIIYEDSYLLIINKPKGIIIHPDDKSKSGTLANMVANYYLKNNIHLNVRFVHRIDTDTTGLIIFAKDIITSSIMNYLISIHEIKRSYLALVLGKMKNNKGTISYKIGNDRHHNQRRRVSSTGEEAITHYSVLGFKNNISLVSLLLETGRTHQIRVHLSHIGYPLLGDSLYGGDMKYIKRVVLHSYRLEFVHPITNEKIEIEAPIPEDMKCLI